MPAGNRIPLFGPKWDAVSRWTPSGKRHPTLDAQNGMSFPMVIQDQKHVR